MSVQQTKINLAYPLQGNLGFPTQYGVLVGDGNAVVSSVVMTNGELQVGNTGSTPAPTTITAGAGITVANAAGAITVSLNNTAWSTVTTTSQAAAVNSGYVTNNASLVTVTLPSTATVGQIVAVAGLGAGGWLIAQNASQLINFGNATSTTGTGGSVSSGNQYDSILLRCTVTNTTWIVAEFNGGPVTVV